MAHRDSGGRKSLLHVGLFLSVVSLCHCASLREGKAPDQSEDKLNISQSGDKETYPLNGRLLIGKNPLQDVELNHTKATEDFLDIETDYQADIGWEEDLIRHDGQKVDMAAVELLLKLEPKVECTVDSMKLQVQDAASAPAALFFVDRGHRLSPLPLSKLPPSCGYTIRSTQKDLVLVAPYDGCFVALEGDSYVLPLRWWGLPLRMSCPLMRQLSSNPPMVTCHAEGMVVKTEWTIAISRIQVNLNGKWEPLIKVSKRCRFSIVEHPEGVVIAINYAPCFEKKDGFFTVELAGDGESKITCPALQAAQPEFPKNHSALQHRSVSSHARDPPLASAGIPQTAVIPSATRVPGFYPSSEMLNRKPSQDVDQSQLPYYLFHPSYMRSHPPSPNSTPPEQPLKRMPTASPGIQPEDPRRSAHYHAPFYPQPPLPEIYSTQQQMIKQPPGNLNQHFPPQSFLHPPFLPQKHVDPPVRPPGNQEQKPFYPYLAFTQQPRFEPFHVDFATPHSSPAEKLPDKPRLVRRPNTEKSHRQGATKVEAPQSHVQQQHHSLHPQTKLGFQPTRKPAIIVQAPQSEMLRNQNRRFYHYPYHLHPKPGVQPAKRPFGVYQPQAAQHRHKPFYAPPKPEMEPQQPETPRGQMRPPLYNEQRLEAQSSENPAAGSRSRFVSDQEVPLGQVQQPMHLYPQLAHYSRILGAPQPGTQTLGEADEHCDQSEMTTENHHERSGQSAESSTHKPPQVQMHHPFRFFYYPWNAQNAQPGVLPKGIAVDERATSETGQQSPNPPPTTPKQCPQLCPSELPSCCPQIAFHHHLHHIVAVGLGSKDAPIIYLGLPFLSSTVSSELGDVLSFVPLTQKPTDATTTQSTTTPSPQHVPLQSFPPVNAEQTYLPPPDGNPSVSHGSSPSETTDFKKPVYVAPNSLYPQWPYLTQNEGPNTLAQSQTPAHYDLPSETRASVNEPENPAAHYGPHNTRSSEQQNSQLSAGNTNSPPRPNFMPFIGQVSQQQGRKQTATDRSFNMNPLDSKGSTHYERGRELDRFLVPYQMLQDAPVLPHNKIVSLNNSQLQSFLSGSKNFTKLEQEPSFYALPLHGALSGNLINNNGSIYDVYSIAMNLAKHFNSQPPSPDNLNYLQAKQPEWLGEEMSNPTPGNIFIIPRLHSDSSSPLPPPALDGLHVLFLPFDPSVKDDLSLHELWRSAMPLEADLNVPPHVPGRMFHRRGSAADQKADGFQGPSLTEPDDEKHR